MADSDSTKLNLANLLAQSAKGDALSYRGVFDHLRGRIFCYILSRCSNRDDAHDITQTVFIDLWQALPKFVYTSDEEFYGFVFLIAKRKLGKHYRSRKPHVELDDRFIADNYHISTEDYRHLEHLLKKLSSRQQEILRLRYWSGLAFKEIATILRIREGTAKVWHHRAVKKLEAIVQESALYEEKHI